MYWADLMRRAQRGTVGKDLERDGFGQPAQWWLPTWAMRRSVNSSAALASNWS
jgi:hypothetical protein